MNDKLMACLKQDLKFHAYAVKAVEFNLSDYELRFFDTEELTYAAIWHQDGIVTLRGDQAWCKEHYDSYYGSYSFYDIEPELMEAFNWHPDKKYELEHHFLMRLHRDDLHRLNASQPFRLKDRLIIKKGSRIQGSDRYQLVEQDGRLLGSVLIDIVDKRLAIISEMQIKKDYRRKGLGYYFIAELLKTLALQEKAIEEIILYVDSMNAPALKLYEKLGFEIVAKMDNLVLPD